ncbi:MAG TPA: hypothetical protein VKG26_12540 [Bacteroidia bacterium]|nr:hypothetical protein [Bacteroidia bacterium]
MKNKKTIIAGSMLAGAMLSVSALTANTNLFNYNALGNGSEVRSAIELNCGEKKAENKDAKKDSKSTTTDKKAKDGKCGEKKAKDGKCGEGKCGEKKNPK